MRILFVSSEGLPFAKTGGLADVVEALPKALAAMGHDVAVVMPRYRGIQVNTIVMPSLTISLGSRLRFPAVATAEGDTHPKSGAPTPAQEERAGRGPAPTNPVQYYFVDDPQYFDREKLYGTSDGDYPDNAERFAEFSRAAVEIAKHVWPPDVIHAHDWQSALVPVLLRTVYAADPVVGRLPVVFTVHNMGYHGLFPRDTLARTGLPEELFQMQGLEFFGRVNYLKGGLIAADYITTVSRRYAQEIQTPEYGHGLEGVVASRTDRLVGILNGVDYSVWSPEADGFIAAKYSAGDLSGKQACKKDLLAEFKLPAVNLTRPLVGIVSRFVDQKGFDLIAQVIEELMEEDLAIVALGTGDARYEILFRRMAEAFPKKFGVRVGFDNALAHKIEAGSDMFLMPSRYEPCGLNQIYSLRYGTVPVVRATGGLDDTIEPFDPRTGAGTGFKFAEYDGQALLVTVRRAVAVYANKQAWKRLMLNGMGQDFSWNASAAEYVKLYEQARGVRIPRAVSTSN